MNTNHRILMLFVLAIFVVGAMPASKESSANQTNNEKNVTKTWVDLRRILKMDDPRKAAEQLLREVREKGLDPDKIPSAQFRPGRITLSSGLLTPPADVSPFEDWVDSVIAERGEARGDTICLIQYGRYQSYNEIASVLSLGVKVYHHIPRNCEIARVPLASAHQLAGLPFIRWIGVFRPEYKYDPKVQFRGEYNMRVMSLVDDNPASRSDLTDLGAVVDHFERGNAFPYTFVVRMDPEKIPEIARLWWVSGIIQLLPGAVDDLGTTQQTPNRVDIRKYYSMKNPRRAAALMLDDARSKGIDIDANPRPDPRTGDIKVPSGLISTESFDKTSLPLEFPSSGDTTGPTEATFLVQVKRRLSIKEKADVLSLGIRIFGEVPIYTYVAQVPLSQLRTLSELSFVNWIGVYKPEYKYEHIRYRDDRPFSVHSLVEDEQTTREDLERLGLGVGMYIKRRFTVRMKASDVQKVAALWWVREIVQLGEEKID
jgi:hypothetical protein